MSELKTVTRGALAGWRRAASRSGCMLVLQIAPNSAAYAAREFDYVEVALNDRQLRSLARDLARAADARGVELVARRPWWRFWDRRELGALLRRGG